MSRVTIIGAGIAGLSAALRLIERGFQVTMLEQNHFAGGKLGAHRHGRRYAEHSYHMYLNWYHSFWQIMEEVGIRDRFRPQPEATYIHRDQPDRLVRYRNAGSPDEFWPNILSGLVSPLDMFLYGYSLADSRLSANRPALVLCSREAQSRSERGVSEQNGAGNHEGADGR